MKYLTSQVFFRGLVVLILGFAATLLPLQPVAAQSRSITVAPFLKEVVIEEGEASKSFDISLTNDSDKAQELQLSVLDFGTLDDSGGVVFAGGSSSGLTKKYGLATWLKLEKDKITVAPSQTVKVAATIVNEASLTPGGHYGAIIASVNAPGGGSNNQVSVNQKLSVLVFATKKGGERYDMSLESISHNGNWLSLPSVVNLRFKNTGNIHITPRGTVKVLDNRGKVIKQGVINDSSNLILPERYRQISAELKDVSKPSVLTTGYKLQVDYRYDGINQIASRTAKLHHINILDISALVFLAILGWLVWRRQGQKIKGFIARKRR